MVDGKQDQPNGGIRAKATRPFKLKDKKKRQAIVIPLKKTFGFLPEKIIIEKIPGVNNGLIVRAIMTPEALVEEEKLKKSLLVGPAKLPIIK